MTAGNLPLASALRLLAQASEAQAEVLRGHAKALRALADAAGRSRTQEQQVVTSRSATSFGMSPRKFRALVRSGEIRGAKHGRYSATVEAVREYLDRHAVATAAHRDAPTLKPDLNTQSIDVDAEIDRLLASGRLRLLETNKARK